MHFLNLEIKSWLISFSQIDLEILLYTHLIQFVWPASRSPTKQLEAPYYVLLLKAKFSFDIRRMGTSLYQITLPVKIFLDRFSFMEQVSLFQMTHCKIFIRFGTLWVLMVINEAGSLHSVTLTTAHVISQMMAGSLNNSNENMHLIHFKDKINGVKIRCKFQLISQRIYTLYTGCGIGRRLLELWGLWRERVKSTQLALI